MDNCLFCKIANENPPASGPSKFEYEDNEIVAFRDIHPKAPVHILIVPKKHIVSIAEATEEDTELLGKMIIVAKKLAEKKQISQTGYRLVFNTKRNAGQVVDHLHLHLLGGKVLDSMA